MPYCAEPSPSTQMTGRSGRANCTPTAAAIANPSPPLEVKK
jgi:hypothetical protein